MNTRPRRFRILALWVLAWLAAITPGCQFLQNEFFYLCPTPKSHQDAQKESPRTP